MFAVLTEDLFRWAPHFGLTLAGWRGRLTWRRQLGQAGAPVASRGELSRLFPALERDEINRIQNRMAVACARNELLAAYERRWGHDRLHPLVEVEPGGEALLRELASAGQGVLLTTWHLGPTPGIWTALERIPEIRLLKVQNRDWGNVPEQWELTNGPLDVTGGVALLRRARKHLKGGGWVAMSFDHTYLASRQHMLTYLGRRVGFRTGLAALAESAGVPIVLMSARWSDRGRRILVKVHDPLYPGARAESSELEAVGRLVGEMETFVRAYPWEQPGPRCRRILGYPKERKVRPDAHRLPGDRWGWKHGPRAGRERDGTGNPPAARR